MAGETQAHLTSDILTTRTRRLPGGGDALQISRLTIPPQVSWSICSRRRRFRPDFQPGSPAGRAETARPVAPGPSARCARAQGKPHGSPVALTHLDEPARPSSSAGKVRLVHRAVAIRRRKRVAACDGSAPPDTCARNRGSPRHAPTATTRTQRSSGQHSQETGEWQTALELESQQRENTHSQRGIPESQNLSSARVPRRRSPVGLVEWTRVMPTLAHEAVRELNRASQSSPAR